jgi:hypothetical protein
MSPPLDDDTRPVLRHAAKLIIGVVVFALGVLAGAAIAAWGRGPEVRRASQGAEGDTNGLFTHCRTAGK